MSSNAVRRLLVAVAVAGALVLAAAEARAAIVANSVADFPAPDNVTGNSKQGINNWSYGYHADPVASGFSYSAGSFIPFPDNSGPGTSPTDFWNGSAWDWHAGNPPWTTIGQTGGHPNGTNHAPPPPDNEEHWAIRRWASTVEGALNVTFDIHKGNVNCGNGTTARVLGNGTQYGSRTIAFNQTLSRSWTVHVPGIQIGQPVDIALDPTGTDGVPQDGCDSTTYNATIDHVFSLPNKLWADSVADFPAPDNSSSLSKQGIENWFYGYHNLTANGSYDATPGGTDDFIPFPDNDGPNTDASDFWNGSAWDWHNGNPPWTFIGDDEGHPNTGGDDHWAIRRWVAEAGGTAFIETFFAKQNLNGGDGIVGRLFHNGVQVYSQSVAFNDGVGFRDVTAVPGVGKGDFIDLVLDYGGNDGSDGSFFSMKAYIYTPEPATVSLLALGGAGALWRRRRRRAG